MSSRRTVSKSSTGWRFILISAVFFLLISGGIVGTLWTTGFFESKEEAISREGQIAYPAIARPLQAYDAITREDLINPQTGQINVVWVPEAQASPKMLRGLSDIIGRVVSRDKQPGYILTERDLLPAGTRPGISAGIPPGKRSVAVKVSDVPGMDLLRQGDLFDLIAVLPSRDEPESNIEQAALLGGIKPPDTRSGQLARQTGIKPLVVAGTMVAITQGKSQSTGGAQGLVATPGGSRSKNSPEMIATIAVDPVEVAPLTEALGLDVDIYCVARSGHSEEVPSEQQEISLDGLVPVLTLARPVEAFSQLTQDDLADSVTGKLNVYYFPPEKVQPEWLTGFTDLNGRVSAKNLSRGAVITESDLFPKGTRPGIAGAIPAGMEVLFVDADRVIGLDRLQAGDRFEIHSQLPKEFLPSATKPTTATLFGGRLSEDDQKLQDELATGMRILSRSAKVLQSAETSGDGKASIAVDLNEVSHLIQALQLEHKLFAVGREDEALSEQNGPVAAISSKPHSTHKKAISSVRTGTPVSLVAQRTPLESPTDEAGALSIPILVDDVLPRTRMSVDEFIEPSTGRVRYLQFPPEQVPDDVVTDLREIVGRRSGRQLYAGEWVLRGDLCKVPQLSVPCDIPSDWSVIEITSLNIRGLEVARVGDRIDLIAVRPITSLALQSKAEWPLLNSKATFQYANREDLFTQGDVKPLVTQAHVVGRTERVIQVPIVEEKETVSEEKQLGDSVQREGVQKSKTVSTIPVDAIVCQIAVPLKSVISITEALAVQSIAEEGAGATNGAAGGSATPGTSHDHEVAIYATLRSPNATPEETIPQRDIVAGWMERWGERFSEFSKSERQQSKAVKTVQHIRGSAVTEEHWLNGNPYGEFPTDVIRSRTVETLIDREKTAEER